MTKWKKSGSYTVEMSLIMPMLVGIIWLMIFLGFYVYDCSLIEYKMISSAYTNSPVDKIDGLAKWEINPSINIEKDKIYYDIKASMNTNRSYLFQILNAELWTYRTSFCRRDLLEYRHLCRSQISD